MLGVITLLKLHASYQTTFRMDERTPNNIPVSFHWKANFMVFIDCISIYGFRSKMSVYLYVICGL